MSFSNLTPGDNAPESVNVVIEIPAHSDPVKYEVDKKTGMLFVDRFMGTSMRYPCNYGYVPHTLSEDGDPVDVLVISPFPLLSGVVIEARPLGMLQMTDEKGQDNKILAVPVDALSTLYRHMRTFEDVSQELRSSISHFFEHYKDLEPNKWVKIDGWHGVDAAKAEIVSSIKRLSD